jgi:hypothetical protein
LSPVSYRNCIGPGVGSVSGKELIALIISLPIDAATGRSHMGHAWLTVQSIVKFTRHFKLYISIGKSLNIYLQEVGEVGALQIFGAIWFVKRGPY